jgi:hypothetical protein
VTITIDRSRYEAAPRFPAYLGSITKHHELWQGMYRTAVVPADLVEQLGTAHADVRLLVLSEDWCSDCFSVLPVIARLAEVAGIDLRVLPRDANLDLMDAHLSAGTRSIPVVMVLDADFSVRAWWGPRPAALQRWYRYEPPSPERSRKKRAWYARDRGRTVLAEILETVERAGRRAERKVESETTSLSSSQ